MEKECNPCQEPPRWEEFWQMTRQLVSTAQTPWPLWMFFQ